MRPNRPVDMPAWQDFAIDDLDFDRVPFTVVWEVTRACALACLHCRAQAQPTRDPSELTTQEGFALLDQIVEFGSPVFVLTGGDPMMRRDIFDLIEYATSKGLRTSLTPSATKLVTRQAIQRAKGAGIRRFAISLDGPTPEIHDAFRQVPGSFQRTVEIIRDMAETGASLQINTTVSRYNVHVLSDLADLVAEFGAVQWSVFLLVPTGRGKATDMISSERHEQVFHWLYDLSKRVPFDVKSTAAQHFRRVVIQREREARERGVAGHTSGKIVAFAGAGYKYEDGLNRPTRGVNDGNGFCFISHTGEVCPSGFLPIVAGNVREQALATVYREAPLFRELRDASKLKGKCGRCEYRAVCGGNRARAYALTGDYLESDPSCVHQPVFGSSKCSL